MAEEPAEEPIRFGNRVVELLEKLGKIPDSAKEVFLWDLIRLASGALYLYRMECVHDGRTQYTPEYEYEVRIEADKDNKTLSITHKGIGWTKEELISGLGRNPDKYVDNYLDTIDKYLMNGDPNPYYSALLRESYCPGLFSAFMVADRVVITTTTTPPQVDYQKKKPRDQYVWDARATDGFFKLARVDPKAQDRRMKRGTKVTLYLKKEYEKTYLDESKLGELVDKYTFDVCPYPIFVSATDNYEREKKRRRCSKDKDREEYFESLKKDVEGLRELCVKALGRRVDKVVVSDTVFDLPGHLLSDGSRTYVINPRSPIIKSLLVAFKKDPDSQRNREKLMDVFSLQCETFSAIDDEIPTYDDIENIGCEDDFIDDDDDQDEGLIDEDDDQVQVPAQPILLLPGIYSVG